MPRHLALHGVGPQMLRLIRNFWETATNVCRAKGNYGRPFKAGRGVTQGGPLSAKLFNILVDAVVREWLRLVRETLEGETVDSRLEFSGPVDTLLNLGLGDDLTPRGNIDGSVNGNGLYFRRRLDFGQLGLQHR